MSRHLRLLSWALGLLIASSAFAQTTFTWTGLGGNNDLSTPGNWLGGVAPSNNPGDDIVFTVYPAQHVALTSNLTIRNITFNGIQDGFWIDQGAGGTIFLHGNVTTTANSIYWGLFDRPVNLAAGNHIFTPNGSGPTGADLYFWGSLTGAGGITKNGSRTLIIGSDHAVNNYSGGTVVNIGTLVVGGQNALGTGTVTLNNGTTLSASNFAGTPVIGLANNFLFGATVNFGGFASNDNVALKLGSNSLGTTLAPISGVTTVNFTQTFGAQEVKIDGELINGASGPTTYTFAGAGLYTLTGDNVHTGGTVVNSGASVIFQGGQSLPNSGLITGAPNSYVGLGTNLVAVDDFTDHINQATFAGTVGFDNGAIYSGDLDLSGFNNINLAVGTKTSATLTGAITPVTGSAGYLFKGNGWLYLKDSDSANPLTGNKVVSVASGNNRPPMMVVVSPAGQNDYFGHTIVEGAGLIFDSLDAHSPNSLMELRSGGYLGITEQSGIGSLLPSVIAVGTHTADSVIGFDSHAVINHIGPGNVGIAGLDLSGITGSIYVGSASKMTLSGTVTTTDGGNGNYYLTGYAGGTLQVDSFLTGTKQVHIGLPGIFQDANNSSGYSNVYLTDVSNNYSGGTVLHSGSLKLYDPGVLGSGALTVNATTSDQTAALEVAGNLSNDINIQSGTLYLNAPTALSLTGPMTGSGILHINSPGVTLAGDSNFSGKLEIDLQDTVTIAHNHALRGTAINLIRGGELLFTTLTPEIGSLIAGYANGGEVELKLTASGNSVLTIAQLQNGSFDGAIIQAVGTTGSVIKSGGATLTLVGHTNAGATIYSGGTTITDGKLIAGTAGAFGTGPITLNGGGVGSVAGVTLTNPISFGANGGTLAGSGIIGVPIVAGTNVHIAPGNSPGTLTFAAGLTLAPAGTLDFEVQSAVGAAGVGYDTVAVTGGALDITATAGSKYRLHVISLNIAGAAGAVSDFNSSGSYSWLLFTGNVNGGLTGFAANKFDVDLTDFANSLGGGSFSLVQGLNGSDPAIYLNFSPVPEPSTYALVASGLGVLWLARRRRH